ncbi:hypothetical protein BDN70DRAFT_927752 [Pholiota conissans]|uniref:HNH nuclease domain-containing protein n=1 Tax=Pholiota conissans TaxID=109636 RepID=A0A9P5ZBL7_9AGAR|nr:hypothetical protein BDN70DRAFT_927752 [Pholiota conissans]
MQLLSTARPRPGVCSQLNVQRSTFNFGFILDVAEHNIMLMSSLPGIANLDAISDSATCSAYSKILELGAFVLTDSKPKNLVYARLLGCLIFYAPSSDARLAIALEVLSCKDNEALLLSGKIYCDYYIYACKRIPVHIALDRPGQLLTVKKRKCRTPSFTSWLSCDGFIARAGVEMPVEEPRTHREAKRNALIRDGYLCVVSGYYDSFCVDNNVELQKIVDAELQAVTETNCTHIFSESTHVARANHKFSSVWTIMDQFGYPNIRSNLKGTRIHRLQNVLTLSVEMRAKFNSLKLWFEAIDKPNTYIVAAPHKRYLFPYFERIVTFTTPDENRLPLPSPEYLEIHASCAKAAHFSGAGAYIDNIIDEAEDTATLAEDSAFAEVLEYSLLQ